MPTTAALLPQPDFQPARVTGHERRSMATRVPTDDPLVFLELSTFHYKHGKQFRSQVMGVRVKPDPVFDAYTCSPMDTALVDTWPVARFAKNTLEAAHLQARKILAAAIADGNDFGQVLAATPEA